MDMKTTGWIQGISHMQSWRDTQWNGSGNKEECMFGITLNFWNSAVDR